MNIKRRHEPQSGRKDHIRAIPDYPKPGIVFRDITPLLLDARALDTAVTGLVDWVRPRDVDLVVAAEARGFILGGAVARQIGAGFVPARKPGKLPAATLRADYALEYGTDTVELHADALGPACRVLVHDDVLATGGTAAAVCALVAASGAALVGVSVVLDIAALAGRTRLPAGVPVEAVLVV